MRYSRFTVDYLGTWVLAHELGCSIAQPTRAKYARRKRQQRAAFDKTPLRVDSLAYAEIRALDAIFGTWVAG